MIALALLLAEPDMYGPRPLYSVGVLKIEERLRAGLKDPESARFEWPHDFTYGWYRRPFGKKYEGWFTCGTINAKNSYGGYVGRAAAIGFIRDGVVVGVDYDDATARYDSFTAETCRKVGMPVK